jgi:hypothetical protein
MKVNVIEKKKKGLHEINLYIFISRNVNYVNLYSTINNKGKLCLIGNFFKPPLMFF